MVSLYLDTEFNGFGGDLISLALAPDNGGDPWYEILELPKRIDPWVKRNVVPLLNKEPLRPLIFKKSFQTYILKFNNPTIICDWFQDAVFFLELLRGKDYQHSLDFACNIQVIKTPPNAYVSKHNALEDAIILMNWHKDSNRK